MTAAPVGWFGRISLRWRLMTIGLAGVAGTLVIGGLLLYVAMSAALSRSVENEARATASDVAQLVNDRRLPDPVPVAGSQIVQVLDAAGRVVAASATADRLTPLVTTSERQAVVAGDAVTVPGSRAARSGELRVVGTTAGPADEQDIVVVAAPTADLETTRRVLRTLLLVFLPLGLGVLALVAWRVIGSTLRPVEELRHGAERIGAGASPEDEHLPVPPTRDEISALATTLNGMLERLASARAQQSAFVADAAHELRSPLATMRTQLEVASRLGEGDGLPDELLPEVDRLAALVEDLLDLARSEDEGRTPATDVDISSVLLRIADRYAAARVPVTVAPIPPAPGSDRSPAVRAVEPEVVRAVGNLVDNAVRHAATRVSLSAAAVGSEVEVVVEDDGHGIPEAERARVFDRFARLDEARDRDSGGSGLGLAITRQLVIRNGGRVRLEDAEPGVRAVVTLPRA